MSEYQFYDFFAVDRPLSAADQKALRDISTRARISATGFTNHYEWGDLKGDPAKFMERWFDLHLYRSNWGTRRFMMRLPERLIDRIALGRFLDEVEAVTIQSKGGNCIINIVVESEPGDTDDDYGWDDSGEGANDGLLRTLAPLRSDVLTGDLRLFYVLWLMAVGDGLLPDDAEEPLPGLGPLTDPLEALAEFFRVDPDLVEAAAERHVAGHAALSGESAEQAVAGLTDREKSSLLARLLSGDPYIRAELNRLVAERMPREGGPSEPRRTVADLRARADVIRAAHEKAEAERAEAERRQREEEAAKAQRARLELLKRRGDAVWKDVEAEIDRRNAKGYERAIELINDLSAIAIEGGSSREFFTRIEEIRGRHFSKPRFMERLTAFKSPPPSAGRRSSLGGWDDGDFVNEGGDLLRRQGEAHARR